MPDFEGAKAEKEATYRLLTKNPWLFKFGEEKLSKCPTKLILMADVCAKFPELNHLRLLKEGLERVYKATIRTDAQSLYAEWLKLIPPKNPKQESTWEANYGVKAELFKDFKVLRNAIKSWEQEIFNYFDEGCQFTNAASEGTNNLIGRMNQAGNGYGFKRLRAKAVFYHVAMPSTIYTTKTIRKEMKSRSSTFGAGGGSIGYMTFESFKPQYTDEIVFSSYHDNTHSQPLSVFDPFPSDFFEEDLP